MHRNIVQQLGTGSQFCFPQDVEDALQTSHHSNVDVGQLAFFEDNINISYKKNEWKWSSSFNQYTRHQTQVNELTTIMVLSIDQPHKNN